MSATATLDSSPTLPRRAWRARLRAWWQSRLPLTDTLLLTQRNVYILPTRAGWMLAATLGNAFMVAHWAIAWWLDLPLVPAHALYMLWAGGGWCLVGAALDRQLIVTGLVFALGGVATVAFPVLAIEFFGLAVLFGLLHAVRVWGRIEAEPAPHPNR